MPARDGTGPLGKGSKTGRGMGNCSPEALAVDRSAVSMTNRPYGFGKRIWAGTFGRFFGRRRANRLNKRR